MAKFGRMVGRKMRMAKGSMRPRIGRPLLRVRVAGSGMHGGSFGSVMRSVVRGTASGVSKAARAAGMKKVSRAAKGVRLSTFRGKRRAKGMKLLGKTAKTVMNTGSTQAAMRAGRNV